MPIETVERDKGLEIKMSGSFDRQASEELEEMIEENGSHENIVVNLFDVNYISSVSIGTLVKLHRNLGSESKSFMISNVSEECQEIFDMIEISEILPIYDDVEDALAGKSSKK